MPRPRSTKPVHLEVAGLAPLPPVMEEWERVLIEPVLARAFDVPKPTAAEAKEVRNDEAN